MERYLVQYEPVGGGSLREMIVMADEVDWGDGDDSDLSVSFFLDDELVAWFAVLVALRRLDDDEEVVIEGL